MCVCLYSLRQLVYYDMSIPDSKVMCRAIYAAFNNNVVIYLIAGKGVQILYSDHLSSTLCAGDVLHHRSSVSRDATPFKVHVQRTSLHLEPLGTYIGYHLL